MSRYPVLAVLIGLLMLGLAAVSAQDEGTGTIDQNNPEAEFTFDLNAGDTARVEVIATSGDLDTIVTIYGPNGEYIIENDDFRPGLTLNSAVAFTASVGGTYTAVVSAYSGTGDFIIRLWMGGPELFEPQYGEGAQVFSGIVTTAQPEVSFTFTMSVGQTAFIITDATGTTENDRLDTIITLYGPDGVRLAENDDSSRQTLNSALVHTATQDGTYTVVVTGYGGSVGPFNLAVTIGGEEVAEEGGQQVGAQSQFFQGEITPASPTVQFIIKLEAGQTVLAETEATSPELDTILTLYSPTGEILAQNDDLVSGQIFNSGVAHTAAVSGDYIFEVSSYGGTTGAFSLTVTFGGEELIRQLEERGRVPLSGPVLIRETPHFVIHYTLQGEDATTEEYIDAVAEAMEYVWSVEIDQMGWAAPPPDGAAGGDERYDVYIANVLDEGILGYASPEAPPGDNPTTAETERYAAPSYLVIDNDFAEDDRPQYTPLELMLTTAVHEFNHSIQFGYDFNDAHDWVYESTATWMETMAAGEAQDATGYVALNFQYPEICFGTKEQTFRYGDWLFIQSLADAYGQEAVLELWRNIADYEAFTALDQTVGKYGDTVVSAIARYRVQNLVRDYDLAPLFGETVWQENIITTPGSWTFTGQGIQELSANYFGVTLPAGVYRATVDNSTMLMLGVGIRGTVAEAVLLGQDGEFSSQGYDYYYLVVVNSRYDDDVDNCTFDSYSISVQPGTTPAQVMLTLDATHFEPLVAR